MRLHIKNFRRVEEIDVALTKPVNLLVGMNGSGKSSILGALTVALTGTHPAWLRRRGESVYALRRFGTKKAEIEVEVGDLEVERAITGSKQALNVAGATGNTTAQQGALLNELGVTADQLAAVLCGGQFVGLPAKEQMAFLAAMGGSELTWDDVVGRLNDDNPNASRLFTPLMAKGYDTPAAGGPLLDDCETCARHHRKEAKSALAGVKATLAAEAFPERPEGEPPTDEERIAHHALVEEVEAEQRVTGQIAEAERALAGAEAAVGAAEALLAEAVEVCAKLPQVALQPLEDDATAAQARRVDAEIGLTTARNAEAEANQNATATGTRHQELRELLNADRCPTCRQPLVGEVFEALRVETEEAHQRAQQGVDAAVKEFNKRKGIFDEALAENATTHNALEEAHEQTRAVDRAFAVKARAEEALASRKQDVANASDRLAELGDTPDVTKLQESLAASMDALEARTRTWETYITESNRRQALNDSKARLASERDLWEWLVEKFGLGPDSYRAGLLGGDLDELRGAVNGLLEDLLGAQVVFPDGDEPLRLRRGDTITPATPQFLSGSELLRLQVALQFAFAGVLDVPLLLIDTEAALDYEQRATLLAEMQKMAEAWPEATILATWVPIEGDWHDSFEWNREKVEPWCDMFEVADGFMAPLWENEEVAAGEGS